MKIWELEKYGAPKSILDALKEYQGDELLPVQEMAVKNYGLFSHENLVVSAPTSSGKTFLGEILGATRAFSNELVFYLVPLKALAKEKFDTFTKRYKDYGLDICLSSHDVKEYDYKISAGNFNIAVIVFEKMQHLLVANPGILTDVGLVVIDELQLLGDESRGPTLEVILTKLIKSRYQPQLLGLSAVLSNNDKVADWLNAKLLHCDKRPIQLYEGVLLDGVFHYREFNSMTEGEEQFVKVASNDQLEILLPNVKKLVDAGDQIIVFVMTKRDSRDCALRAADYLDLPPANGAIKELSILEETRSRDMLLRCLESSVAFHNADLSIEEREIIEEYYRSGEIKVISSTTTLAMGMNLPAKTVFVLDLSQWEYNPNTGRSIKRPLTKGTFANVGGRAGRLGLEGQFGRSIVIGTKPFHRDYTWRNYIEGEFDQLHSHLGDEGLEGVILDIVASDYCKTRGEVEDFLLSTFAGVTCWKGDSKFQENVDKAVERLLSHELLIETTQGDIRATKQGHVCALQGISIETATALTGWLASASTREFSTLEALHVATQTKDGLKVYVPMVSSEYSSGSYEEKLREAAESYGEEFEDGFEKVARDPGKLSFPQMRAAKLALILTDWIRGESTAKIEKKYNTSSGSIQVAAETISWIISTAAALSETLGCNSDFTKRLKLLAEMVFYGVPADGLTIARLQVRGLSRSYVSNLIQAGYTSPRLIQQASDDALNKLLPNKIVEALKGEIERNYKGDSIAEGEKMEEGTLPKSSTSNGVEGTELQEPKVVTTPGIAISGRDDESSNDPFSDDESPEQDGAIKSLDNLHSEQDEQPIEDAAYDPFSIDDDSPTQISPSITQPIETDLPHQTTTGVKGRSATHEPDRGKITEKRDNGVQQTKVKKLVNEISEQLWQSSDPLASSGKPRFPDDFLDADTSTSSVEVPSEIKGDKLKREEFFGTVRLAYDKTIIECDSSARADFIELAIRVGARGIIDVPINDHDAKKAIEKYQDYEKRITREIDELIETMNLSSRQASSVKKALVNKLVDV